MAPGPGSQSAGKTKAEACREALVASDRAHSELGKQPFGDYPTVWLDEFRLPPCNIARYRNNVRLRIPPGQPRQPFESRTRWSVAVRRIGFWVQTPRTR